MIFATDVQIGPSPQLAGEIEADSCPPPSLRPRRTTTTSRPTARSFASSADSPRTTARDFNSDLYTLDSGRRVLIPGTSLRTTRPTTPTRFTAPTANTSRSCGRRSSTSTATASDSWSLTVIPVRSEELAAAFNRSCQNPKWPDAKRLTFEADHRGTAGIYFISLDDKMPSTEPPPVSERSIAFARDRRLGVYLRSSFDTPPTVFAHGPGMKDPIQLDHFNDDLETRMEAREGRVQDLQGSRRQGYTACWARRPGATSRSWTGNPPSASPRTSRRRLSSCTAKKTSVCRSPKGWPITTPSDKKACRRALFTSPTRITGSSSRTTRSCGTRKCLAGSKSMAAPGRRSESII